MLFSAVLVGRVGGLTLGSLMLVTVAAGTVVCFSKLDPIEDDLRGLFIVILGDGSAGLLELAALLACSATNFRLGFFGSAGGAGFSCSAAGGSVVMGARAIGGSVLIGAP